MYQINKKEGEVPYGLKYNPTAEPICDDDTDFMGGGGYSMPEEFSQCNRNNLLNEMNKVKNLKCIVEIGVARAQGMTSDTNTTVVFGDTSTNVLLTNKSKDCIYIGIDLDDKSSINSRDNNVYTIMGDSANCQSVYDKMNELGVEKIDLLLIDGWHSVNQCLKEWRYTEKLSDNGIVIMHDTNFHPGPYLLFEAVDEKVYDKKKLCPCGDTQSEGDWGLSVLRKK